MSSDNNVFERLFKLWASICKLLLDGKRDASKVADILQGIVDGVYDLKQNLLTDSKFDWVDPNITPENFPNEPVRAKSEEDYKVYHFNRGISSEDAVAEMTKDGYLPSNLYESLSWQGWNGIDTVVALGSSCVVDGNRRVPCRDRDGAERYFVLRRWDGGWGAGYRFLAVATPKN